MADFILHHYDTSPFSEKPRVMFGLKGLALRSVIQPVIMPKPELVPLTGGYRRIPVMQIGADIYCDTQVILAEIEARAPSPALVRGGDWAVNISRGGIFINTRTPLSVGTTVRLIISLPDTQFPFELSRRRWRWCSAPSATMCRRRSSPTARSCPAGRSTWRP